MSAAWFRRSIVTLLIAVSAFAAVQPAAAQTTWVYTALGDSISWGAIALYGFVPRYAYYAGLDTGMSIGYYNQGRLGWTSAQLLNALRTDSTFRSRTTSADVITYQIGGNDMLDARSAYKAGTCGGSDNQDCLRSTVQNLNKNYDNITVTILSLRGEGLNPNHTIIRTMDLYNPYVADDMASNSWPDDGAIGGGLDVNDFVVFKYYLEQFNRHVAKVSSYTGIKYARVYAAFNGSAGTDDPVAKGWIAFDGLHPNDTGHQVIATLLRRLGYAPLK